MNTRCLVFVHLAATMVGRVDSQPLASRNACGGIINTRSYHICADARNDCDHNLSHTAWKRRVLASVSSRTSVPEVGTDRAYNGHMIYYFLVHNNRLVWTRSGNRLAMYETVAAARTWRAYHLSIEDQAAGEWARILEVNLNGVTVETRWVD